MTKLGGYVEDQRESYTGAGFIGRGEITDRVCRHIHIGEGYMGAGAMGGRVRSHLRCTDTNRAKLHGCRVHGCR